MITGLECLSIVARYHYVNHTAESIGRDWHGDSEPSLKAIGQLASQIGLHTKAASCNWKQLQTIAEGFPVLATLKNGCYVVICGIRVNPKGEVQVLIKDPRAKDQKNLLPLSRSQFVKQWSGKIVFIKPVTQTLEVKEAFGFKWLISQAFVQRGVVGQIFAISLMMHMFAFVVPIFTMVVFDKVVRYQGYSTLHVLFVGAITALVFNGFLGYIRSLLIVHIGGRLDIVLSERATNSILGLPLSFFKQHDCGKLVKKIQEASAVREFVTGNLLYTLIEATAFVVFLPVLFFFSLPLTLIVVACAGVIAVLMLITVGAHKRQLQELYKAEADRQAMIVESIMGAETIKVHALEKDQSRRLLTQSAIIVGLHKRLGRLSGKVSEISGFFQRMMSIAIIWLGVQYVLTGELTIGMLIAFNIMAGRIAGPLVQMVGLIKKGQETALSVNMLAGLINQAPERLREGGITLNIKGGIEFKDVDFSYNKEAGSVLSDVNFSIEPGMKVGVVGPSGSGKSSLANLVLGLYRPNKGIVRIDGYNIQDYDLDHLRRQMGVVMQEGYLFKATVRENIAKSVPGCSLERIIEAAKLVDAHEFIENLPHGYDTVLDENASNLSGGQRQRICFARAILADPTVMVLDEATSALDADSEQIILDNLHAIAKGRTLLHISHRMASMLKMDKIIVVDQGKIIAYGQHNKLLNECELYQRMWRKQLQIERKVA